MVTWVNEARETGLPYDVRIDAAAGAGGAAAAASPRLVEVKTALVEGDAASVRPPPFDISLSELQCAAANGSAFTLYRVVLSAAGGEGGGDAPQPRVFRVLNLDAAVRSGQIRLLGCL